MLSLLNGCANVPRPPTENSVTYEVVASTFDTDETLPMIVALHYMGGSADTSREDYANITQPARIILLQGSFEIDSGYSWFPGGYYQLAAAEQSVVTLEIASRVADVIEELTGKYATNALPIITGYSQGADIAHVLALHHGSLISAIIPMGARFETEWTHGTSKESMLQGPVNLFHGDADETVSIIHSQKAESYYQSFDVPVHLTTFEGVAHAYPQTMKEKYEDLANELLLVRNLPVEHNNISR